MRAEVPLSRVRRVAGGPGGRLGSLAGRRGSVLVLVIAVLVLLALMGTAYIVTSRSDRVASAQSEASVSIDALGESVIGGVKDELAADRVATVTGVGKVTATTPRVGSTASPTLGQSGTAGQPTGFAFFDYPTGSPPQVGSGVPLLASRTPSRIGTNTIVWENISQPLGSTNSVQQVPFVDPTRAAGNTAVPDTYRTYGVQTSGGSPATSRRFQFAFEPTSKTLADGTLVPAFQIYTADPTTEYRTTNTPVAPNFAPTTPAWTAFGTPFAAADADGDGIADAGLVKIGTLANPEYSGVTFFYGLRLIDNNSAVNINTAGSPYLDYKLNAAFDRTTNDRVFPSAVNLVQLLSPTGSGTPVPGTSYDLSPSVSPASTTTHETATLYALHQFRFGGTFPGVGQTSPNVSGRSAEFVALRTPYGDLLTTNTATVPYSPARRNEQNTLIQNPAGPLRPDFEFATLDELTWMQLGRRLDNPGLFNLGTGATYPSGLSLQSFGMQDQAALASGFVLATRDPSRSYTEELARRSAIEQVLPYSTYRTAQLPTGAYAWTDAVGREIPTTAYAPNQTTNWYRDNFTPFVSGGYRDDAVMSLRPLLVARNPVSQAVAAKPLPHWAVMSPPVPQNTSQIAWDQMSPYAKVQVGGKWKYVPVAGSGLRQDATPVPVKVDVNAAAFGDLWRAYYSVMASDQIDPRSLDTQRPGGGAGSVTTVYADTVSPFGPYTPLTTPTEETYRGMGHAPLSATTEDLSYATGPVGGGPANMTAITSVGATPEAAAKSTVTPSDVGTPATFHPQRMFRSSVKDFALASASQTRVAPDQMVLLRSAQAAVNAEYHRTKQRNYRAASSGPDIFRDDVIRRSVPLKATVAGSTPTAGAQQANVLSQVYSVGRFPFISEVYVSTNPSPGAGNPNYKGYVAVELFNPHPYAISLAHFRIERVQRTPATALPASPAGRPTQVVYEFGAAATAPVIPPLGTIVLENRASSTSAGGTFVLPGKTASSGATTRPPKLTIAGTSSAFYVEGLDWVLESSAGATGRADYEMVISRPMIADINNSTVPGTWAIVCLPRSSTDVRVTSLIDTSSGTPGKEPQDYFVPVDSIDFTGVRPATTGVPQRVLWPLTDPRVPGARPSIRTRTVTFSYDYHYARSTTDWRMVYPGRYDGRTTTNGLRQQGLREIRWRSSYIVAPDPAADGSVAVPVDEPATLFLNPPTSLGAVNPDATYTQDATGVTVAASASKRTPSIQIANSGGFVRELDLIQSPYVSPVRLRALAASPDATPVAHTADYSMTYMDVISLTADAAFAEDTCTQTDLAENIGRFAPILVPRPAGWNLQTTLANAIAANQVTFWVDEFSVDPTKTRYGWATRLTDYLTVMPAGRMSLPVAWDKTTWAAPAPFVTSSPNDVPSQPVSANAAAMQDEDPRASFDAGVNGQININTAPVSVLAAIPWVRTAEAPPSSGTFNPVPPQTQLDNDRAANLAIARAIVAYRQANGPFRHILELNRVPGFRTRQVANASSTGWAAIGAEQTATPDTTRTFAVATRTGLTAPQKQLVNDSAEPNPLLATANGDFSPEVVPTGTVAAPWGANPPPNGLNALIDFEPQYLVVTAVSNLITTRSDTFTAYLVIEGWRDAGTPEASRVYQRRYAYILDRTGVAVGTPNADELLDPAYVTPVVQPESSGAFVPLYWNVITSKDVARPRFESSTVRTTSVPVPPSPTRVGQ